MHFMGLGKPIMTCTHHYTVDIIQSGFTALKILCAPPIYPIFPLSPWQQPIFGFTFSGMSYSWNHTVRSVLGLASFTTNMYF